MTETTFRFTRGPNGMTVAVSYDTGWNEGLDCGGEGGWLDEVALNDDDAAIFRIRNIKTNRRLSICGVRSGRGMTFSVVALDETTEGFEIDEDSKGFTIVCYGPSSLEYDPAVPAPRDWAEAEARKASGQSLGLTARIPGATV